MLHWLISAIGLAALKSEISAMAERAGRRAILYVLIVVLWLTALGFAVATFTIWLSGQLGAIAACGIIAAALAVLGLALQLGLTLSARRRSRPQPPSIDMLLAELGKSAGGAATDAGPLGPLALVAVLGWLLGRQMGRK